MTNPIPEAIDKESANAPAAALSNAVDENTPIDTTPADEPVEPVAPEDAADVASGADDRIGRLESTVDSLLDKVLPILDAPAQVIESAPVEIVQETVEEVTERLPWTHRRLFGGGR